MNSDPVAQDHKNGFGPLNLLDGVFNLCQRFEISYSRYANKHFITGVYIAINDIYSKFGNAGLKSEIYYLKKNKAKQKTI